MPTDCDCCVLSVPMKAHTQAGAHTHKPAPVGECWIDCEKALKPPPNQERALPWCHAAKLGDAWSMFQMMTLEGNQEKMIWRCDHVPCLQLPAYLFRQKCSNAIMMCWNLIYWFKTKHFVGLLFCFDNKFHPFYFALVKFSLFFHCSLIMFSVSCSKNY